MTRKHDSVDKALDSLKAGRPDAGNHINQLEKQLMSNYRPASTASFISRHRAAIAIACLLFVGGTAIATTIAIRRMRMYEIDMTRDGEVFSQPRVLVEEGQEATITVGSYGGDEEDNYTIEIGPDGEVVYEGPEDVELDVNVEEIEGDIEE